MYLGKKDLRRLQPPQRPSRNSLDSTSSTKRLADLAGSSGLTASFIWAIGSKPGRNHRHGGSWSLDSAATFRGLVRIGRYRLHRQQGERFEFAELIEKGVLTVTDIDSGYAVTV